MRELAKSRSNRIVQVTEVFVAKRIKKQSNSSDETKVENPGVCNAADGSSSVRFRSKMKNDPDLLRCK